MESDKLRLILQTLTNWGVGGVISAAWLMGKIPSETALIPLMALAGLEVWNRKADSRRSAPPGDEKTPHPLPPAGPTAAALLMALDAFQGVIG